MRVKIVIQGHQIYNETRGEVLSWMQQAEQFDTTWLQVPAILLKMDDGTIGAVSLKTRYTWTEVKEIE